MGDSWAFFLKCTLLFVRATDMAGFFNTVVGLAVGAFLSSLVGGVLGLYVTSIAAGCFLLGFTFHFVSKSALRLSSQPTPPSSMSP